MSDPDGHPAGQDATGARRPVRGVFARQKAWERPRRFIIWDRRGGASATAQWFYRHPVLGAGLAVGAILAFGAGIGSAGDPGPLLVSSRFWILAVLAGWGTLGSLRATGQLYQEWSQRPRRPADQPASDEPATRGRAPSGEPTPSGEPPDEPAAEEPAPTAEGGGILERMDRWNQRSLDEQSEVEAHGGPAYDSPMFRAYWGIWLGAKLGIPLVALAVMALLDRLGG